MDVPHYGTPFDSNWSYLGFLGIIWRTCGSKCRGGGVCVCVGGGGGGGGGKHISDEFP